MSNNIENKKIWLIGSGPMAVEYAKTLQGLKIDFIVIGRGEDSATKFFEQTGVKVHTGGLKNWLKVDTSPPLAAIIAVSMEQLFENTLRLLQKGVKNVCENCVFKNSGKVFLGG